MDRMYPLDYAERVAEERARKKRQREALWHQEFIVETNSGTFSSADAVRAIGAGDPALAEYRIYERVGDGRRRTEGCAPHRAPGTVRRMSSGLTQARRQLKALED